MTIEAIPITSFAQVKKLADLGLADDVIAAMIRWPVEAVREALRQK